MAKAVSGKLDRVSSEHTDNQERHRGPTVMPYVFAAVSFHHMETIR